VKGKPLASHPGYSALDKGAIWDLARRREMPTFAAGASHRLAVNLPTMKEGRTTWGNVYLHLLIAQAFLPPRPKGFIVGFKDGNPSNCAAGNLEWVNRSGRPGVRAHSKLSEEDVRTIRRQLADDVPERILAERFGVSQPSIHAIANKETWAWLPD
jgi:hypothetical protein